MPIFRHLLITAAAGMCALRGFAAHTGPIAPPTDPFGAPGPYAVETREFPSPQFAGQVVTVFLPAGLAGPRPTWFFCHGFGGFRVVFYEPLLRHLATHGWVAVFSPYSITGTIPGRYEQLMSGFEEAAARYPDIVDTRKIGFSGHSFGGGAAPTLLLRAVRQLGWGSQARCLMPLAPWYSFELSDADLGSYPAGTQVVMQVYEDDVMNDHRMAIDVFRRLGLPTADKDFVLLRTDVVAGYAYQTGHNVPGRGAEDAIFERGVQRIIAALSASCFDDDPAGRAIALGGGSPAQRDLGADATGRALRPMDVTDDPQPRFAQSRYEFPFSAPGNPRLASAPPEPTPQPAHLVNLSVRVRSEGGDRVLVAGAVLDGSAPKSLLVRAVGPGLVPLGVSGSMTDPRVVVFRGSSLDVENDQWEQAANVDIVTAASAETGAFPLAPGSTDAALCLSFAPGPLTAHVLPATGAAGVALVELYDADLSDAARLVNLSGRAYVGTGDDVLIAGFVIQGAGTLRVLVRAVGPTLASLDVADVLADPQLLVQPYGAAPIASNDDWGVGPDAEAIGAASQIVGAFALPEASKDACVLLDLPAGIYTAHASDTAGRSGNVLVEVYALP